MGKGGSERICGPLWDWFRSNRFWDGSLVPWSDEPDLSDHERKYDRSCDANSWFGRGLSEPIWWGTNGYLMDMEMSIDR